MSDKEITLVEPDEPWGVAACIVLPLMALAAEAGYVMHVGGLEHVMPAGFPAGMRVPVGLAVMFSPFVCLGFLLRGVSRLVIDPKKIWTFSPGHVDFVFRTRYSAENRAWGDDPVREIAVGPRGGGKWGLDVRLFNGKRIQFKATASRDECEALGRKLQAMYPAARD